MNDALWMVVPAAGYGERMGGSLPKQYMQIGEHCLLQHTLTRLLAVPDVQGIVVVLAKDDSHWSSVAAGNDPRVQTVVGGQNRTDSVLAGLQYVLDVAAATSWVLVHDAARPMIQPSDIKRLTDAVFNSGAMGGILATPVQDTLKKADDDYCIESTIDRSRLWQAQTPQLFRVGELIEAVHAAHKAGHEADPLTDEASAMERMGHEPLLVEALQPNLKITRPADLVLANAMLNSQAVPA